MTPEESVPRLSLVLATYNRGARLRRLLDSLAQQTLAATTFEVVVVDDGSVPPAREVLGGFAPPFRFRLVEQGNGGAAVARHRGVLEAKGDVLVITDDDMILPPGFLAAHLAVHAPGTRRAALGRILWPDSMTAMPLFERWHALALRKQQQAPGWRPHGDSLCTGNTSMRRSDYLAVGGFDPSLQRGEDMDLGLRLELAGVEIRPAPEAWVTHDSDHTSFAVWRGKCLRYGEVFLRMSRKYPELVQADPWRFFFANSIAKRPFVTLALVSPTTGRLLADAVEAMSRAADRAGLERLALGGVSLLWDLEYFRGLRARAGGLRATVESCLDFLRRVEGSGERWPGVGRFTLAVGRAVEALLPGRRGPGGIPSGRE